MPFPESAAERTAFLDRLVARVRVVAESRQLKAIQRALPISFGGLLVGLAFFYFTLSSGTPLQRFSHSFGAAFGVMSVVLAVVLPIVLARARGASPVAVTALAFAAFALSLPYGAVHSFEALMAAIGSSGLFLAIGVALAADTALQFSVARFGGVAGTLAASALVLGIAGGLYAAGISLAALLSAAIAPLGNLGDSLTALLLIVLIETLLWAVGIHGPALLAPVLFPVYMHLQLENTEALARHEPLPHIVTISMFLFVFPGGAGATLPLVLLLLRSKVARVRKVALATLLPAFANTNEPLMFGLPLAFNPILGLPFVAAPMALAVVSWWAMHLGLVAKPAYYVPYAIPIPISTFSATLDWRSVLLMAVNIALGLAIYAPFVRAYERSELAKARNEDAA